MTGPSDPDPAPRRRRRRAWAWGAVTIVGLVATWVVWAEFVIFHPHVDEPTHADAIVVLGPSLPERVDQAEQLASKLGIDQLILSIGDTPGQAEGLPCTRKADPAVTCFVPDPYDTRGEARAIADFADQRGWSAVVVMALPGQVSRARLLVQRCFPGTVEVVEGSGGTGPDTAYDWLYALVHQSLGFAKAALQPGC